MRGKLLGDGAAASGVGAGKYTEYCSDKAAKVDTRMLVEPDIFGGNQRVDDVFIYFVVVDGHAVVASFVVPSKQLSIR